MSYYTQVHCDFCHVPLMHCICSVKIKELTATCAELTAKNDALLEENSSLSAHLCPSSYANDSGNKGCREIDRLREERDEDNAKLIYRLEQVEKERDALILKLTETRDI